MQFGLNSKLLWQLFSIKVKLQVVWHNFSSKRMMVCHHTNDSNQLQVQWRQRCQASTKLWWHASNQKSRHWTAQANKSSQTKWQACTPEQATLHRPLKKYPRSKESQTLARTWPYGTLTQDTSTGHQPHKPCSQPWREPKPAKFFFGWYVPPSEFFFKGSFTQNDAKHEFNNRA